MDTQRINHRRAGVDSQQRLSDEKIARLDEVGFVWSPRKSRAQEVRILERKRLCEGHWEDYYQRLVHYKSVHGVSVVFLLLLPPMMLRNRHCEEHSSEFFCNEIV